MSYLLRPNVDGHLEDDRALRLIVKEFKRLGVILESDQRLPCITALVVGERVKGSWWSHPKGRLIWRVLNRFLSRKDVLTTRLISGKVTFVYRGLWPDFLAIGISQAGWQMESLSANALTLFGLVQRHDKIRTDDPRLKGEAKSIPDTVRELERRLLLHSEEVHTERGSHAKLLESWNEWSRRADFNVALPNANEATSKFEELLRRLNQEYSANGRLPWPELLRTPQ
jgi:hypothetical protein